jgi:hypothetical protein
MTKSVQVLFISILLAMISATVYSGEANNLAPTVTGTKNRAIQNPVIINGTAIPAITISSPPNQGASTTQPSANFTITTSRPATICWKLNNGMSTCSAPGAKSFNATLFNLPSRNHTLEVTAADATGNITTSVRNWSVIIE